MSCGVIRNNLPCGGYNECFENNGIKEGVFKTYHKDVDEDEYYLYKEIPYINGRRIGKGYIYLNLIDPIIQTTLYYEDDKLQKLKYMTHSNNYITLEFGQSLNIANILSIVFSGEGYEFRFEAPFGGITSFKMNNCYNFISINIFDQHYITYVFNNNNGYIDFSIHI